MPRNSMPFNDKTGHAEALKTNPTPGLNSKMGHYRLLPPLVSLVYAAHQRLDIISTIELNRV